MLKEFFNEKKTAFIKELQHAFSSQDSKFFLITALKFFYVTFLSYFLLFLALEVILELNYHFLSAHGFTQDQDIYFDIFVATLSDYTFYAAFILILSFLAGLFVSYLSLKPLDDLEIIAIDFMQDINKTDVIKRVDQNKHIYKISDIFFRYLGSYIKRGVRPNSTIPSYLLAAKKLPLDWSYTLQFATMSTVILFGNYLLMEAFTHDFYQAIIANGLEHLSNNKVVNLFLDTQQPVIQKIFYSVMLFNVCAFFYISLQIIKKVNGVFFGISRDMIKIVQGDHKVRLRPRANDPGQELSQTLNDILDEVFPHNYIQLESLKTSDKFNEHNSKEFTTYFDSLDDLNHTQEDNEQDYKTCEHSESPVLKMLMQGTSPASKVPNDKEKTLKKKEFKPTKREEDSSM